MSVTMMATVQWMKPDLGGRVKPPAVGLRPTIRFQRYIKEWLEAAWDVEIVGLKMDSDDSCGSIEMRFSENAILKPEWLQEGELIELLDGHRVIGVGRISGAL